MTVPGEVLVRPEAPSLDPEPAGTEPFAEMRDRTGAEGDVDERVALEDQLALRLRVAAADRDHELRVLPLAGACVAKIRSEPRVGLLADRACVEDDDVGLLG